jgi:hypothetical protein
MSRKQTAASFWARVNKTDLCWEWTGACNSSGYGTVSWDGNVYTAHRIAAWISGMVSHPSAPQDPLEKGYVLHKCDNRKCCNPDHFFVGNYSDNQIDAYAKKRRAQPKGQYHSNSKLTNAQAAEIRARLRAGELQIPLSKEYGVSQRVISLIKRGETYHASF